MKMTNKVAIDTGAASGIGRSIALAFAREGANVAIADLNLEGAKKVAADIHTAGGQAIGVARNVTSEEEVIKKIMLKDTVDGEFTTVEDVAEETLFLAAHPTNAFTGQSLIVSHGWSME